GSLAARSCPARRRLQSACCNRHPPKSGRGRTSNVPSLIGPDHCGHCRGRHAPPGGCGGLNLRPAAAVEKLEAGHGTGIDVLPWNVLAWRLVCSPEMETENEAIPFQR